MPDNEILPRRRLLSACLNNIDDHAVTTVRAAQGGPFGASLYIYNRKDGMMIPVGGARSNAVRSTGLTTAHAEDQTLEPEDIACLVRELVFLYEQGAKPDDISVIALSTGESCPACHAKEEIAARYLYSQKLIQDGRFFVFYGASYEDTKNVTGFDDLNFLKDMQKGPGKGLITLRTIDAYEAPSALVSEFARASAPVAAVAFGRNIFMGHDRRGQDNRAVDLKNTAEIDAIKAACLYQKSKGRRMQDAKDPILYTSTTDIGPMTYAEALWANIRTIVTVRHDRQRALSTQEARHIPNRDLFSIVTRRPYNHEDSAVRVERLSPFANKAQQCWRTINNISPNGIAAAP